MAEVWQEMHCQECMVYFGVTLEDSFSGIIGIRCGICKHPHTRRAEKGVVLTEGRYDRGSPVIEYEVLKSQCYAKSRVNATRQKMEIARRGTINVRDGIPVPEEEIVQEMTADEKVRRQYIEDLWLNKFQNEKFGN